MNETAALLLLRKHATSTDAYRKVAAHSRAVRDFALELAAQMRVRVDTDFVAAAALLHDIGRFACPPPSPENAVRHGIVGARILRDEGYAKIARCTERHVGAGITRGEARKLGLPVKSYVPATIEEKIVCYADSLTYRTERKDNAWVVARYRREAGEAAAKRQLRLHNFLTRRMR